MGAEAVALRQDRAESSPPMRRLAVLVSAMAMAQTLLFSALAPLLPTFDAELGLSKAQAGLLVAMFPIGLGIAGLRVEEVESPRRQRIGLPQEARVEGGDDGRTEAGTLRHGGRLRERLGCRERRDGKRPIE